MLTAAMVAVAGCVDSSRGPELRVVVGGVAQELLQQRWSNLGGSAKQNATELQYMLRL